MASENIYRLIAIDEQSITPKYLQVINSMRRAIEERKIEMGYILPSINELSYELDVSRDTAERAYRYLKQIGIIGSVPGKGYFITSTEIKPALKIFLLFNKLSTHKKIIYDAFAERLGQDAAIDFYIYNNDFSLFKKLVSNIKTNYTHHVIIPHFLDGGDNAKEIIQTMTGGKLVLLDKQIAGLNGTYSAIYEDFENDIYNALEQANELLSKYQTLKIIFPDYTYHPREILLGFFRFCHQYAFNYKVIADIVAENIQQGDVFISLMENDLVMLIEKILTTELRVGEDVGVISYNETPIKKIILNGITTISTDFEKMGGMAADVVLNNEHVHQKVPFTLTIRNSL